MWRWTTVLAALMAVLAALAAPHLSARSNGNGTLGAQEATPAETALFDLAKKHGTLIRLRVGRECPTCLRGTVATEDIAKGEEILAMPLAPLGMLLAPSGYPSEYARDLLLRMKVDPAFKAQHSAYWATMPALGSVLCSETFTDELIDQLHTPALETLIRGQRNVAYQVFDGTWDPENHSDVNTMLGDDAVTLDEFLHVAGLIGTRDFGLSKTAAVEAGSEAVAALEASEQAMSTWMLPIADLINHGAYPNAIRSDNGTHVLFHALEDISAGEEITADYQWRVLRRNDMTIIIYGFVLEENFDRLLAVDLPDYNPEDPYRQTPEDDTEYYGPDGRYNTREEAKRLRALLEQAEEEATEEEDEEVLEAGVFEGGWKEEMVVRMRLGRKKALRRALEMVEAELDAVIADA